MNRMVNVALWDMPRGPVGPSPFDGPSPARPGRNGALMRTPSIVVMTGVESEERAAKSLGRLGRRMTATAFTSSLGPGRGIAIAADSGVFTLRRAEDYAQEVPPGLEVLEIQLTVNGLRGPGARVILLGVRLTDRPERGLAFLNERMARTKRCLCLGSWCCGAGDVGRGLSSGVELWYPPQGENGGQLLAVKSFKVPRSVGEKGGTSYLARDTDLGGGCGGLIRGMLYI